MAELTLVQAANLTGVSRAELEQLIDQGKLRYLTDRQGRRRVSQGALEEALARHLAPVEEAETHDEELPEAYQEDDAEAPRQELVHEPGQERPLELLLQGHINLAEAREREVLHSALSDCREEKRRLLAIIENHLMGGGAAGKGAGKKRKKGKKKR